MRYLFTTLMLCATIFIQAQEKTKTRPGADIFANEAILFPSKGKGFAKSQMGNNIEGGIDIMFRKKPHRIYMSTGGSIGYINLVSVDAKGNEYYGDAYHVSFFGGMNYLNDFSSNSPIRLSSIAGFGLKLDGTTTLGYMPYCFLRMTAVKYINRYVGVGVNVSYHLNLCTKYTYAKYSSTIDEGIAYNLWSVGANLRFTIPRIPKPPHPKSRHLPQH